METKELEANAPVVPAEVANSRAVDFLYARARAQRIPISVDIEITARCNFKCIHCYIPHNSRQYLSVEETVDYMRQIRAAGTVFLTLTGGEPLLHPGFVDIYEEASRIGFAITVFSNASLIDSQIIGLFDRMPPRRVEVSLYGSSAAGYRTVAGRGARYDRVLEGLELLLNAGVNVKLKTVLFRGTDAEIKDMKEFAQRLSVPFEYAVNLFPRTNGDRAPVALRLPAAEVVSIEQELDGQKAADWCEGLSSTDDTRKDEMFECGAGTYSCKIDSSANVKLCNFAGFSARSLRNESFSEIWDSFNDYAEMKKPEEESCSGCSLRKVCDTCPISGFTEAGSVEGLGFPVAYNCELATHRAAVARSSQG